MYALHWECEETENTFTMGDLSNGVEGVAAARLVNYS